MGAFSNFIETRLLDHVLGTTTYTKPAAVFVGLLSAAASGEAGTVTEVAGGGYARQAVTFAAAVAGDPSSAANSSVANFGDLTTDGSATHFGIYDAASAGNLLAFDVLRDVGGVATTVTWTGAQNQPISFPVASLSIRLD